MIICMSKALEKHSKTAFDQMVSALTQEKLGIYFLPTDNIWARDYMPIQTGCGNMVKFKYKGYGDKYAFQKYPQLEVDRRCWDNGRVIESGLRIDGGNFLLDHGRLYTTDIIFAHNPQETPGEIVRELIRLTGLEPVILPCEPGDGATDDGLGHADGILRGVAPNKVLVNDYSVMGERCYDDYLKKLLKVLDYRGIKYDFMPFAFHKQISYPKGVFYKKYPLADDFNPVTGYYINFLPLSDAVLGCSFGIEEDAGAEAKLKQYFKRVYMIDCADLSQEGGLVNCTTREYYDAGMGFATNPGLLRNYP